MLVEVRRREKYPDLIPDLYDNLYKTLSEVKGNCFIRLCRNTVLEANK